jgi:hypothetical protein
VGIFGMIRRQGKPNGAGRSGFFGILGPNAPLSGAAKAGQGKSVRAARLSAMMGNVIKRGVVAADCGFSCDLDTEAMPVSNYESAVEAVPSDTMSARDGPGPVTRWSRKADEMQPVLLVARGPRSSLLTLVAAALERKAIDRVDLHGGMGSLKDVLEKNMTVNQAPELFCFGLQGPYAWPGRSDSIMKRSLSGVREPGQRRCGQGPTPGLTRQNAFASSVATITMTEDRRICMME